LTVRGDGGNLMTVAGLLPRMNVNLF
jgi:hypothetical protein